MGCLGSKGSSFWGSEKFLGMFCDGGLQKRCCFALYAE